MMSWIRRVTEWISPGRDSAEHQLLEQLKKCEQLVAERRLQSVVKSFRRLANTELPAWGQALVAFQHGAVLWTTVGDGALARKYFQKAVEICQSAPSSSPGSDRLAQTEAYATENLMLLSLSFDEFFQWAERLKQLAPHEPVLSEHVPMIRNAREKNQRWSEVMKWSAHNYFDADPSKDPGRHGCAASFFHLMLTNRRDLRLSREQHAMTLVGYSALLITMWSSCGEIQLRLFRRSHIDEFQFLLEPARVLLDEFLERTPGHERVQDCRNQIEKCYTQKDEAADRSRGDAKAESSLNITTQRHFLGAQQMVGGPPCVLYLKHIDVEGPNCLLEYQWKEQLDALQADGVDTKARAFLNCAVGAAARVASLSCREGTSEHFLKMPNGEFNAIPGWYLEDRDQPTYVVNSQFDVAAKSVYFTIGTPQIRSDSFDQHDPVTERLAAAFQQAFAEVHV